MLGVFREVCAVAADDGVTFDIANLAVDLIREELRYGGLRLRTTAVVGGANIRVVIDIGFGDAIDPEATEIQLPALLDFPAPRLRAYPREVVIAERLQAMVMLGRANSRMKDFYDIGCCHAPMNSRVMALHARLLQPSRAARPILRSIFPTL